MSEDAAVCKKKEDEIPEYSDKIIVIGDSATVTGFKLAGVSEAYVAEGKDAEKRLTELLDRENAGIIIVTESIMAGLDWRIKRRIEGLAKPVVVSVPDKTGSSKEVGRLSELIKRALGFDLGGK